MTKHVRVSDDIRQLSLPPSKRASEEQIEAARAIVKKLRFKYAPERIENPKLQKHWINIEAIALNRPQPDEFVDYTGRGAERQTRVGLGRLRWGRPYSVIGSTHST